MSRVHSIAGIPQCYASIVEQWLFVGASADRPLHVEHFR